MPERMPENPEGLPEPNSRKTCSPFSYGSRTGSVTCGSSATESTSRTASTTAAISVQATQTTHTPETTRSSATYARQMKATSKDGIRQPASEYEMPVEVGGGADSYVGDYYYSSEGGTLLVSGAGVDERYACRALSTGTVTAVRVVCTGTSAVALIAARLPFKGGPGELYPPELPAA